MIVQVVLSAGGVVYMLCMWCQVPNMCVVLCTYGLVYVLYSGVVYTLYSGVVYMRHCVHVVQVV